MHEGLHTEVKEVGRSLRIQGQATSGAREKAIKLFRTEVSHSQTLNV